MTGSKPPHTSSAHIRVTDHAIVRYMERVLAYDMEALRRFIAEQSAPAMMTGARAMTKDGVRYVFEQGVVITITTEPQRLYHRKNGGVR